MLSNPGVYAIALRDGAHLRPCQTRLGANDQSQLARRLSWHIERCSVCRLWLRRHWPRFLDVVRSWRQMTELDDPQEFLRWAKARALEYLPRHGQAQPAEATASFARDLWKHPAWRAVAGSTAEALVHLQLRFPETAAQEVRLWIERFPQ